MKRAFASSIDGKIVFETKAESDPDALHCALKGYVEHARRIGIEASSIVRLARELLFRKLPVIMHAMWSDGTFYVGKAPCSKRNKGGSMTTKQPIQDGAYRGRRLSWDEFYLLTGRTPPIADNDNRRKEGRWRDTEKHAGTGQDSRAGSPPMI